jgi:hypothetical protein
MVINIYSSKPSNIKKLGINYVIFSNNVDAFGNIAVYHVTFMINQNVSNTQNYSTSLALPTTINMTGGATVVMLLGGIDVYSVDPSTATIDFTNEGVLTDQSTLKLTISSKSPIPTFILSFTYIYVLYNYGFLASDTSKFVRPENGVTLAHHLQLQTVHLLSAFSKANLAKAILLLLRFLFGQLSYW